jgi:uncharacterized membrane protein YhaH (DUF805 family)
MSATRKNSINFDVIKKSFVGTFNKYAVLKGRARRQEFWIFFFCTWILGLIPIIGTIISLVTIIPSVAVGVRRLHDTNRSGLWLLLIYIPLPLALILFLSILIAGGGLSSIGSADFLSAFMSGLGALVILLLILPLVGIIILLIWAAQPGTAGKNKYGPNPKTKK